MCPQTIRPVSHLSNAALSALVQAGGKAKGKKIKNKIRKGVIPVFKYIPVLRYRVQERAALKTVKLSKMILPLIEVVKEKPIATMKGNFQDIYSKEFSELKIPLMIDLPLHMKITKSTDINIQSFLQPLQADPSKRLEYFKKLSKSDNVIPVASYNPEVPNIKIFKDEIKELINTHDRIAIRLFPDNLDKIILDINKYVRQKDILLLDVDEMPIHNQAFSSIFNQIVNIDAKTVLIRSAIPRGITNLELPNDAPIFEADNCLLKEYKKLGFDGFGDYAGIKKELTIIKSEGAKKNAGFIFYYWFENIYVGFRGRFKDSLKEFPNHIVPSVLKSKYFKQYSSTHQSNCPCCISIQKIFLGDERGESLAKWKRFSIMHYLHTMEEFL